MNSSWSHMSLKSEAIGFPCWRQKYMRFQTSFQATVNWNITTSNPHRFAGTRWILLNSSFNLHQIIHSHLKIIGIIWGLGHFKWSSTCCVKGRLPRSLGGSRSFKRLKLFKFFQVEVSQRSFFLSMTLPTFSFEPYEVCFSITEETWFSTFVKMRSF